MSYRKSEGPTIDEFRERVACLERELKHSEGRTEYYRDGLAEKRKSDWFFTGGVVVVCLFFGFVFLWMSSLPRERSAKQYRDLNAQEAGVACPLLPGDCLLVFESGEVWNIDCSSTDVCLRKK